MFEGKCFSCVGGTLSSKWSEAIRRIQLLDRTYNSQSRIADRPEGDIDWGSTLSRGPTTVFPEYVIRSSGVGLTEPEYASLVGWKSWISREWADYVSTYNSVQSQPEINAALAAWSLPNAPPATNEQLLRWAHLTRRSRWPILRELVSASLRIFLEPDVLNAIPIPAERDKLFELICLVRIARQLAPSPDEIRWLDHELNNNQIDLPGVTCYYQQYLKEQDVLSGPAYANGLADAINKFGVKVHKIVDLAFKFNKPRNRIAELIIEAKSGGQDFSATVEQLRAYSYPRPAGERMLIWGIVENSTDPSEEQLNWLRKMAREENGDIWAFSNAGAISKVIEALEIGDSACR